MICPLCERDCPDSIMQRHHLRTRRKDKAEVESEVTAQPGDWIVKQANGEVQRIEASQFESKLRYVEVR